MVLGEEAVITGYEVGALGAVSSSSGIRGEAPAAKSFCAFWVLRVSLLQSCYAKLCVTNQLIN